MTPLLLALPGYFYYYSDAALREVRFAMPRMVPDFAALLQAEANPSKPELNRIVLDTDDLDAQAARFFNYVFADASARGGLNFHSLYNSSIHPGCLRTAGVEWNLAFPVYFQKTYKPGDPTIPADRLLVKESQVVCMSNPLGEPPLQVAAIQIGQLAQTLEEAGHQVHLIQRGCSAEEISSNLQSVQQFYYAGHARWKGNQIEIPLQNGWHRLQDLLPDHGLDLLVLAACLDLKGQMPDIGARAMLLPSVLLADRPDAFVDKFAQRLAESRNPGLALQAASKADADAGDTRRWNYRLYTCGTENRAS